MTAHDFRPGDVVEFQYTVRAKKWRTGVVSLVDDWGLHITKDGQPAAVVFPMGRNEFDRVRIVSRPVAEPAITIQRPGEWSAGDTPADPVDHPAHYTGHPSGVECITVTEYMTFNVGNAVKYLWRAGRKGDALEDLRKAAWYVNREIERLTREAGS